MRKILITNDDGITADGLYRLARTAKTFGDVWVVAPESQRSAASHSITLHSYIDVYPYDFPVEGVHAFSCSGTPADCVRVGSLNVMKERPDVVLSGINYGYNACSDIQYSATAGAAFEGTFQGYLSIALSEGADPCHEVTDAFLGEVLETLLKKDRIPGHIYNVNFPQCPISECKGILWERTVSEGMFFRDRYRELENPEHGGMRLMVDGQYNEDAEEGSDFRAIVDGYVSVGIVNNIGYTGYVEAF